MEKKKTVLFSWIARIAVLIVFIGNIQCAFSFLFFPESFMGAYELSGVPGRVAIQGIAVAFLMWNTTYPLVIVNPARYCTLFLVILVQQAIGLVGESYIFLTIEPGYQLLTDSILRFIIFDGVSLIIMLAAFIALRRSQADARKEKR